MEANFEDFGILILYTKSFASFRNVKCQTNSSIKVNGREIQIKLNKKFISQPRRFYQQYAIPENIKTHQPFMCHLPYKH